MGAAQPPAFLILTSFNISKNKICEKLLNLDIVFTDIRIISVAKGWGIPASVSRYIM